MYCTRQVHHEAFNIILIVWFVVKHVKCQMIIILLNNFEACHFYVIIPCYANSCIAIGKHYTYDILYLKYLCINYDQAEKVNYYSFLV